MIDADMKAILTAPAKLFRIQDGDLIEIKGEIRLMKQIIITDLALKYQHAAEWMLGKKCPVVEEFLEDGKLYYVIEIHVPGVNTLTAMKIPAWACVEVVETVAETVADAEVVPEPEPEPLPQPITPEPAPIPEPDMKRALKAKAEYNARRAAAARAKRAAAKAGK
jgi:hypothetical protein